MLSLWESARVTTNEWLSDKLTERSNDQHRRQSLTKSHRNVINVSCFSYVDAGITGLSYNKFFGLAPLNTRMTKELCVVWGVQREQAGGKIIQRESSIECWTCSEEDGENNIMGKCVCESIDRRTVFFIKTLHKCHGPATTNHFLSPKPFIDSPLLNAKLHFYDYHYCSYYQHNLYLLYICICI